MWNWSNLWNYVDKNCNPGKFPLKLIVWSSLTKNRTWQRARFPTDSNTCSTLHPKFHGLLGKEITLNQVLLVKNYKITNGRTDILDVRAAQPVRTARKSELFRQCEWLGRSSQLKYLPKIKIFFFVRFYLNTIID